MARTAPIPNIPAIPGMCPGIAVLGGGAGSGGKGGKGAGAGGGGVGADGSGGANGTDADGRNAQSSNGQCGRTSSCPGSHNGGGTQSAGDPVDVATGRMFLPAALDLLLPAPLPLGVERSYSSAAAGRDVGLGPGWTHSFAWSIEVARRGFVVWKGDGTQLALPAAEPGEVLEGPAGITLHCQRDVLVLAGGRLTRRFVRSSTNKHLWLLDSVSDTDGNTIQLRYVDGALSELVDCVGRVVRVARRGQRIHAFMAPQGDAGNYHAFQRYHYDDHGYLVAVTDAAGYSMRFGYETKPYAGGRRMTRCEHRDGLTFHYRYQGARCVETWGTHANKHLMALAAGLPTTLADGTTPVKGIFHVKLVFYPDGYREIITADRIDHSDVNAAGTVDRAIQNGRVYSRSYDERGNVASLTDPMGHTEHWSFDETATGFAYTDPMGHVTSYAFDPSLAVSTVTTADGYVLTRRNNEAGHILGASDDAGDVIQYHYSSRGELLCATTPDGAKTSFEYDHWGNRTAVIEPDGSRKTITYDVFGRPTSVVDAAGGTTRFEYDVRGGVVSITRPNGASERFTYDAGGRVRTYTDADGGVTSMRWGHQRRVMELTKANGDVTHYRYDYDGRLVSIQNSAQQQHHLHYDPSGWLTAERTFGGRTLRYTRDLSGTLTSFTQGDEQPVLLTRDATGVVTAREYPDGAVHQLSHDEMGRLTRAVTDDTECRRQYDSRGNLIEEYQTVAGDSCWVRYTYDAMGRRLSRSSSRGHQDVFYRDAAGRLERIALDDEDIRFRYSADGRIIDRQLSRGLCVRTHYDSELRLVGRDVVAPAPTTRVAPGEPARVDGGRARAMAWRRYQYSLEGKLTTVSDEAGTTSLTYDACGQLLQRHGHNAATSERYNYLPGGLVVEAHDDAPERDYDADGRVLRRGDERFTYDTCGRLTSRQSAGAGPQWRYQYDGAGMLVSATKPGECRVNHSYDALGRRLLSRIYDGGGRLIKTRRFIWDENILLHVITRRWNARGGYRETERSYVIGPASHAPWAHRDVDIDGDERRAGAWVHYVNDAVGAPHMLVNGDGSALRRVNMSSWGAVSGECDTALRLPGCYADEETGLLYNRWRYLDPGLGRYLTPDPLGLEAGLDAYGYVGNAPNRFVDPDGLYAETVITDVHGNQYTGRSNSYYTQNGQRRAALHPAVEQQMPGQVYHHNGSGGRVSPNGSGAPPGSCAEPDALSQYLYDYERRTGKSLNPDTEAGRSNLGVALSQIPNDGMVTTWQGDNEDNYARGERMAACPNCGAMMANMRDAYQGPNGETLRRRAPAPGNTHLGRRGREPTRRYEPPTNSYRWSGGTGRPNGYY